MVSFPLVNLWNKKSLVLHFSWMNIKLRYKGSYLGLVWAVLEPLLMFSVLYLVFTHIRDNVHESFPIYLISGLIFYQVFSKSTLGGLMSLKQNHGILESLNIRREIFPVINAGTAGILLVTNIGVLFTLMAIFNFIPPWTIIFLPIVLVLFLLLVLGVCYLLSIVYLYVRDIQPFWTIIAYALLFASPTFWYVSEAKGFLLIIQQMNPLGQIMEFAHKVVVFGEIPSINEWAYTTTIILGIFFFGYFLFDKFQRKTVELL